MTLEMTLPLEDEDEECWIFWRRYQKQGCESKMNKTRLKIIPVLLVDYDDKR